MCMCMCACGNHRSSLVTFLRCCQSYLLFLNMIIFPTFISVHHVQVWSLQRTEWGGGFLGTAVIDGSELLCGFWEWNLHPSKRGSQRP